MYLKVFRLLRSTAAYLQIHVYTGLDDVNHDPMG